MQGFPNSDEGWEGGKFSPVGWENRKFYWGIFLPGEGNLRMSDFDASNLFQN